MNRLFAMSIIAVMLTGCIAPQPALLVKLRDVGSALREKDYEPPVILNLSEFGARVCVLSIPNGVETNESVIDRALRKAAGVSDIPVDQSWFRSGLGGGYWHFIVVSDNHNRVDMFSLGADLVIWPSSERKIFQNADGELEAQCFSAITISGGYPPYVKSSK